MANDANQIASSSSRDLAYKVLGGFVIVSIFDPIIFEIIHEHFGDSQVFVYRLFNILYGVLPLFALMAVWGFDTPNQSLYEQKLKKLISIATLAILFLSITLFYSSISFSFVFPVCGLVILVLGMVRHYQNNSEFHIKKVIKVHLSDLLLMLILLLTFGAKISKDSFKTNLYQESYDQYEILNESKKKLSDLKNEMLIAQFNKSLDLIPKGDSITRKNIEIKYHTKCTIDAFYPLFMAIRVNEFYICSITFIMLIWVLSYSKFRGVSEPFYYSVKVAVWVYALLIFNLMQSVSVNHITAEKDGFMYYIGNWYVPNAISNVTNNTITNNDNRASYAGDITNNNGDEALSLEVKNLIAKLLTLKRDSTDTLNKKLEIHLGPVFIYGDSNIIYQELTEVMKKGFMDLSSEHYVMDSMFFEEIIPLLDADINGIDLPKKPNERKRYTLTNRKK
jgi:hypothetical protein